MKMLIEKVDSYVESIKIKCTPLEALVLHHAMQLFAANEEMHEMDRDIMKQMLKDFAKGLDQGCEVMKREVLDNIT